MAFINDTFTDIDGTLLQNHTADDGGTWAVHPGSAVGVDFIVSADRIYHEDGLALYYHSAAPSSSEYDVSGVFKILGSPQGSPGITARMDTTAQTHYMVIYSSFAGALRLYKTVSSVNTLLDEHLMTPVDGDVIVFTFQVRDALKQVLIGGSPVLSTPDNSITTAGRVGVRSGGNGNTSTTGTHIDSISAALPGTGAAVRLSRSTRRRRLRVRA